MPLLDWVAMSLNGSTDYAVVLHCLNDFEKVSLVQRSFDSMKNILEIHTSLFMQEIMNRGPKHIGARLLQPFLPLQKKEEKECKHNHPHSNENLLHDNLLVSL